MIEAFIFRELNVVGIVKSSKQFETSEEFLVFFSKLGIGTTIEKNKIWKILHFPSKNRAFGLFKPKSVA